MELLSGCRFVSAYGQDYGTVYWGKLINYWIEDLARSFSGFAIRRRRGASIKEK